MVNFDQQFILINIRSFVARNHVKEFLESVLLNVSSYLLGDVHETGKGVLRLVFAAIWFGKIFLKKISSLSNIFYNTQNIFSGFSEESSSGPFREEKKIQLMYLVILVLQLSVRFVLYVKYFNSLG